MVSAINKGRRSQLLNDFCIFSTKKHFQHTWCSFWQNFLLPTKLLSNHWLPTKSIKYKRYCIGLL